MITSKYSITSFIILIKLGVRYVLYMYITSDLEKLWFLYQTKDRSKEISINAFCMKQGVSYNQFYSWPRMRRKSIASVEVGGKRPKLGYSLGRIPFTER